MTTGQMTVATKGEIERDARELLEALSREKNRSPRSLNVEQATRSLTSVLLKDSDA